MASQTSTDKGSQKARGIGIPLAQRLFDLKSAATYLGRPVWGVRTLVWNGELPVVRSGRKMYLDIEDMNRYIERQKETMV
jgi:excisionase family DNA binding protein